MKRFVACLLPLAAALSLGGLDGSTSEALACGTLRGHDSTNAPSLSVEQVLIVYDAKAKTEHFIRQIVFRSGKERFGFVVPTPARAEVEAVPDFHFSAVSRQFPFDPKSQGFGGEREGRLGGAGGVKVLEKKRVGSFTAFVLAASDREALSTWMKDNALESDAATDAWLAHYVDLGFHFVAFRFEPPKKAEDDGKLHAETIRVSFPTPAPCYPYLEPARPAPAAGEPAPERVLALWLVSNEPLVPVALADGAWVRPFQEGPRYDGAVDDALKRRVGKLVAPLLPEGPWVVQTFEDQKRARTGFGDVVFVPEKPRALDADAKKALAPLLALLDPKLQVAR